MEKQNRLVIYPSPGMGDLVWITPHLRVLAKSIGPFSLLIPKSACAETLLKEEGFLNAILPFSRKVLTKEGTERNPDDYMHQGFKGFWRLVRDLKKHRFDEVWIFDRRPLFAWACYLAGIPKRYGYGFKDDRFILHGPFMPKQMQKVHARARATAFMAAHGLSIQETEQPLNVEDAVLKKIKQKIKDLPKPIILFGIGATDQHRKWQAKSFAAVATHAMTQFQGTLYIVGGPKEMAEARTIKKYVPKVDHDRVMISEEFSIEDTLALAKESALYFGNDTFLLNVMAMEGRPTLTVFRSAGDVLAYRHNMHALIPPDDKCGTEHVTVDQAVGVLEKMIFSII